MTDPIKMPATAWWHVDVRPDGLAWHFTPEARELLGIDEDADAPGLDQVMATHHPDDGDLPADASDALHRGRAFAHNRRLVRPDGDELEVMALGFGEYDDAGELTGVNGVFIDVSRVVGDVVSAEVTAQLHDVLEARGTIEQAKGVLMQAYGIDVDEAFELLGWYSQRTNTRVRTLADRLAQDAAGRPTLPHAVDAYLAERLDQRAQAVAPHVPVTLWSAEPAPLELGSERLDGHVIIRLSGDVDSVRAREAVPMLRDALASVPRSARGHALDLSRVGYLSPSAVVGIAGVITKHLHQPAEMRVLPGWTADALEAAGVPAGAIVR